MFITCIYLFCAMHADVTCRGQFSSSTIWVPGIELRLSDVVATTLLPLLPELSELV